MTKTVYRHIDLQFIVLEILLVGACQFAGLAKLLQLSRGRVPW